MQFSNYNRQTIKQMWTRPMKLELRSIAPHMTLDELTRHYGKSGDSIKKMCIEVGTRYKRE